MTATGKARSNDTSFESFQMNFNARIEGLVNQNTNIDHGQFFTTAPPQPTSEQKFFNVSGDTLGGSIGYNASKIQIVSDAIDIGEGSGKYSGFVILEAETGTSDDLSSIDNFQLPYQDLTLLAQAGHTITLTNVGNIDLSSSLVLDSTQAATLFFDILVDKWKIKGGIGTGGGGAVSFPIDFPVDDLGTLGAPTIPTLNFSWVPSDRHAQQIFLDGDLTIDIGTDLPADTLGLTMFKLKQDSNGGHSVLFTGIANTSPSIDGTPNNTTYIGVQRMDNESLAFTVGDKIFIGSSGEQWSEFPATQTINLANNPFINYFGWTGNIGQSFDVGTSGATNNLPTGDTYKNLINGFDRFTIQETGVDIHNLSIVNAAAISIVDVGSGTARGSISGDPGESAMRLSLPTGEKFIISDVITNIVEFDNAAGLTMIGTHGISVGGNNITNISDIADTTTPLENLFVESVRLQDGVLTVNRPSMTSLTGNTFDINFPTGSSFSIHEQGIAKHTFTSTSLSTENIILSGQIQLADSLTDPIANGDFRTNGVDVKVFSGGTVRNMSEIGQVLGANTELSNLDVPTLINTSLISDTANTDDLGSALIPWRIVHIGDVQFDADSSAPNSSSQTQITKSAAGSMEFNVNPGSANYNWYFSDDAGSNWSMTASLLSSFEAGILIDRSLTFNSSGTNPAGDGELTRNGDSMLLQSPTVQFQRATTGTFSGELALVKIDAAPSGGEPIYEINFNLLDSPTTLTYAQIVGGIEDVTNAGSLIIGLRANGSLTDMITMAGRAGTSKLDMSFNDETILKAASGNIGYFVTSDPDNLDSIGTEGTIQVPTVDQSPTLDGSELDALFGNFLGACGVNIAAIGSPARQQFYIKISATAGNGTWAVFRAESILA